MSSEIHKYNNKPIDKNKNLFNAKVISFPSDKIINETKEIKIKSQNIWSIGDKSNVDQLKAVVGLCFLFVTLTVIGLYSNLT